MTIKRTTYIRISQLLLIFSFFHNSPAVMAEGVGLKEADGSNWKLESDLVLQGEFPDFYAPTLDLKGTYYFEPIAYTSGPYAEHDFLNPTRAFSVSALYEKSIGGTDDFSGYHLGFDSSIKVADHLYQPRAHYTDFAGRKTYGAGMQYGFLLTDSSRISAGISLNQEQIATGDVLASRANLGYKKLWMYDSGRAFATEIDYEQINSKNESRRYSISKYNLDLDYYITPRWGFGLNLNHSRSDLKRFVSHGIGASTSFYFNPNFGLDLGLGIEINEENTIIGDLGLSAVIRF